MLIDWFTVSAQALNFLVLVWLLKRFLYRPILDAIDAREKRIAAQLQEAAASQAEAVQERDELRRKNEEIEQQRAALLRQASREAQSERRRLVDEARRETAALRAKWQETLKNEQQCLQQELTRRVQREVFAIARQVLADLAGSELETRMAELLLQRLRALSEADQAGLAAAFKNSSQAVLVRSAYSLPPAQQATLSDAIRDILAMDAPITFETAPDLIGGIELFGGDGHQLAWSIADYLASLENSLDELLQQTAEPATESHAD